MDWSGALGIVIAGVAGLLIISLMFWAGHSLLNWLEDETSREPKLVHGMYQPAHGKQLPVPDGQERLATQLERDDVNGRIERPHSTPASRSVQL